MHNTNKKPNNLIIPPYRGRFAPTPSGELHFGSLLAAMASYADARSHKGTWLVRIDDIDQARMIPNSASNILSSLEQCGFQWDESIYYQSQHISDYQEALNYLSIQQHCYPCHCSRKQLKTLDNFPIYPGLCRPDSAQTHAQQETFSPIDSKQAIRIQVNSQSIQLIDQIQKHYQQNLAQEVGDFIIYRRDQVFSYQLATVIDDHISGITHIVRGFDLLESTIKQIFLQQLLAYTQPEYAHIPIAVNQQQLKLSKLSQAKKISNSLSTLIKAAHFLGQKNIPSQGLTSIDDFWSLLIANWDINLIPKMEKISIMY